ncbi:MAG: RidA family protein [Nitrospinota bacterium]
MRAAGATFDDVVECTRYVTNLSNRDEMNGVWAEHFKGIMPTMVTLQVHRVATDPRVMIEGQRHR